MSQFELLKQIQNPEMVKQSPLPKGIKYDEQKAIVEGKESVVFVPHREAENFKTLTEGKDLTLREFNQIMRDVRGIRKED